MTGTYELTKYQAANLKKSANQKGCQVFVVVGASEDDSPSQRAALQKEMQEMDGLVELWLLKDVSEQFQESIKISEISNKRGFRVFAITEAGLLMFKESGKKWVN